MAGRVAWNSRFWAGARVDGRALEETMRGALERMMRDARNILKRGADKIEPEGRLLL